MFFAQKNIALQKHAPHTDTHTNTQKHNKHAWRPAVIPANVSWFLYVVVVLPFANTTISHPPSCLSDDVGKQRTVGLVSMLVCIFVFSMLCKQYSLKHWVCTCILRWNGVGCAALSSNCMTKTIIFLSVRLYLCVCVSYSRAYLKDKYVCVWLYFCLCSIEFASHPAVGCCLCVDVRSILRRTLCDTAKR